MSEEEKLAIESITSILKQIDEGVQKIYTENLFDNIEIILKLIEKQQKEIEQYAKFVLDMKEKINNFQFEAETGWRKIEKLEELLEE